MKKSKRKICFTMLLLVMFAVTGSPAHVWCIGPNGHFELVPLPCATTPTSSCSSWSRDEAPTPDDCRTCLDVPVFIAGPPSDDSTSVQADNRGLALAITDSLFPTISLGTPVFYTSSHLLSPSKSTRACDFISTIVIRV
jgi:hypothetical protein